MATFLEASEGITTCAPLEVSPLDLRSYRAITLSNRLQVLLISDQLSDKAAAALNVSVGHFSDPEELPGLAHFLEHMLFLGTEKYPEEGSYNKFLAENGGHSNAYTDCEDTNYHFEMIVAKSNGDSQGVENGEMPRFKEALDRFAQFFTAPLFTESATERELNAVHSEHQKNLQNDARRIHQVKKVVCNAKHPYYKFGTGSKETLWDTPREVGIDTRAALLKFHKKYYSANLMSLCIIGPYDLDQLQVWVSELFSAIPNHNAPNPADEYKNIEPLLPHHRGLIFQVETIKDIRQLELNWIAPSYHEHYRSKPGRFVGALLGDEGEGSIISLLKAKGWADSLGAGLLNQTTFSTAAVSMTLTKEGVQHIDDIIEIVYDYIRMIRASGIQEWLFREEGTLAEAAFLFRERGNALDLVTSMASSMHHFPPAEYLSGLSLFKEFDNKKVIELLGYLTPANGNIFVAGKFVSNETDSKERWYKTPYKVEPVDDLRLRRWTKGGPGTGLRIPEPNPFIPTEFDLLAEPLGDGEEDVEGPKEVFKDKLMEVHHKLDRTFRRPKAVVVLQMRTPFAYRSPWHAVMTNIFTYLLEDELTEYSYAAEKAGFGYELNHATTGMRLHVTGYSHRIDVLLDAVVKKMTTLQAKPTRYEMIRDIVEREYVNFEKNQPYGHAMYSRTYLLEDPRWHVNDYLRTLRDGSVTLPALNQFVKDIQKRFYIIALVSGNISEESAVSMIKSVRDTIQYEAVPEVEQIHRRVVQVPTGQDVYVRMEHPNADDNNSAIEVLYQIGPRGNFGEDVRVDLMANILNKPTFHELRTVQQLGYIVFEGVGSIDYVYSIYFIVQSTVASPDELLRRIDAFLIQFREDVLMPMSEEKFQDYVRALITTKAEPDKRLSARSWRFWSELVNGHRQFDRAQKEIAALQLLSKQDIVRFFDDRIARKGCDRRRVVSQVYGNLHPLKDKEAVSEDAVEVVNCVAFRRQHALFPCSGY